MNTRTKALLFTSLLISLSVSSEDYKFEIDKDVKCLIKTPSGENLTINSKVLDVGDSTVKLSKPPILSEVAGETIDIKKESCTHLDIEEVEGEYFEVIKVMKKEKVEVGEDGSPLTPGPTLAAKDAEVNKVAEEETVVEPEAENEPVKKGMGRLWIIIFSAIALSPALIFLKGKGKAKK